VSQHTAAAEPANKTAETVHGGNRPVLRIVRGDATAEEIAALVAVLGTRTGSEQPAASRTTRVVGGWADPARLARRPLPHGPGAWRASAWN